MQIEAILPFNTCYDLALLRPVTHLVVLLPEKSSLCQCDDMTGAIVDG